MKKNKKWALLLTAFLLLGSVPAYAENGSSLPLQKVEVLTYKDNNDIAIKEQPNFLEGLEKNGRDSMHMSINGFQVFENYFPKREWFYTEEDGTLMAPLMVISEMMGAVFANKSNQSITFEKNGKTFIFEKDRDYYLARKEKKPLRHVLVEKDKVLYAPFYDLLDAYEMLLYIDRNKQRINFDKVSGYPPYEVQVIVWDKEMQLFKKDNPELQKIVHAGAWTAKYNKLFDQENRTDYVLLDTKSRYRFQLLAKDEDGKTGFASGQKNLSGFVSPVQTDGSIKTQFLYDPSILSNGHKLWFHEENQFRMKDGTPYPFTVTYSDLEEAGFLAFHIYSTNIMTVVLNPFYKDKKGVQ